MDHDNDAGHTDRALHASLISGVDQRDSCDLAVTGRSPRFTTVRALAAMSARTGLAVEDVRPIVDDIERHVLARSPTSGSVAEGRAAVTRGEDVADACGTSG